MLPLGFAGFLLFGFVLVLLGATQDALAADLGLDLTRSGLLGAVLSLGIGSGVLLAGPLVDRLPRRPLFLAASVTAAGALLAVGPSISFPGLAACVLMIGVATGSYETLLNAVTLERYRERSVRPIAALHAATTVGAVLAPPLIGWLAVTQGWTAAFRALGGLYLAFSVWVALVALPAPVRDAPARSPFAIFTPTLVALCVVGFAYVGIEAALTLFAVPYAHDGLGLEPARGRGAISVFWLGLLAARLGLALAHGRVAARYLAGSGVAGALVLAAGPALGWQQVEIFAGLAGLALGGVFPLMVALAGQHVPDARGSATGMVAGFGSLGGFAIPWCTGALGDRTSIALAIGALAAWSLCIALAAAFAARAARRS